MPSMKFTVRSIEAIKPDSNTRVECWDDDLPGFGLRVSGEGRKSWIVMYRFNGRLRRLTMGTFPALNLADARDRAKAALHDVAHGRDPAADKAAERIAETFAELADEYLERHAKLRKRTWQQDERIIDKELLPKWKHVRAKDVQRKDVMRLLDGIAERGALIQANRVLALTRKIFNFGIQRDIVTHNPCHMVPAPGKEQRRDRVLDASEIKKFWDSAEQERPLIANYFRLILLTAQRPGEVWKMEWSEVNLEEGWWTIPAEKAKNGLQHRVALSPHAREILVKCRVEEGGRWVFPSPRKDNCPIENIQKAIQRIRSRVGLEFIARDLRRTAASHMTRLGVSRLVVSKILNHKESGVTAVYDRYSYDREKRQAVDLWGEQIEKIISDKKTLSDVVPLASFARAAVI